MAVSLVSKLSKSSIATGCLKRMKLPRFHQKSKPLTVSSKLNSTSLHTSDKEIWDGKKYVEVFRRFDIDGDGKISCDELSAYFALLGEPLMSDQARRVVAEFDSDGDYSLELKDFIRLVERDNAEVGDDIRRAFEMYALDKGQGCITPESLQRTLRSLGVGRSFEECIGMIRAFDLDGNGVLDLHEFQLMMS
ncbi:hypothetical protein CRG98_044523 [Punica granatum]|uniref:EF-hand domain-containing protein n=3 Tax=Punica granatum TaxID=22663 RepID=A0A2I0HU07_PUNGR|nr:hypothetical protein CRG98_044523 [Punica granatum]